MQWINDIWLIKTSDLRYVQLYQHQRTVAHSNHDLVKLCKSLLTEAVSKAYIKNLQTPALEKYALMQQGTDSMLGAGITHAASIPLSRTSSI